MRGGTKSSRAIPWEQPLVLFYVATADELVQQSCTSASDRKQTVAIEIPNQKTISWVFLAR